MKSDLVSRKVFERCITILNVFINIIRALVVQVFSIFGKLHFKFKSFAIEKLKIP